MLRIVSFILLLLSICAQQTAYAQLKPRILIFSATESFRHDNIEEGALALMEFFETKGLQVEHSEDVELFTEGNLLKYEVLVFFNTTGNLFNAEQKRAFQKFINSDKGFIGIHAACDTEHDWPWYGKLLGAYFKSHPAIQEASIEVQNRKHPSAKHLPEIWRVKDEWYDYDLVNPAIQVLMNLDEKSYKGGKMGENHPIAWFHEFESSRVFYTGLGHRIELFEDSNFLEHLWGGMRYVLKDSK